MNYLYILQQNNESVYKIGISNDVEQRIKQLQTGNPKKIIKLASFPIESRAEVREKELEIHDRLKHFKTIFVDKSEWFVNCDKEINQILKEFGQSKELPNLDDILNTHFILNFLYKFVKLYFTVTIVSLITTVCYYIGLDITTIILFTFLFNLTLILMRLNAQQYLSFSIAFIFGLIITFKEDITIIIFTYFRVLEVNHPYLYAILPYLSIILILFGVYLVVLLGLKILDLLNVRLIMAQANILGFRNHLDKLLK